MVEVQLAIDQAEGCVVVLLGIAGCLLVGEMEENMVERRLNGREMDVAGGAQSEQLKVGSFARGRG